jgi:peptidylprolyl isomerase
MTPEERIEEATKLKEKGTNEFTSGSPETAANYYKRAADLVDEEEDGEPLPDEEKDMYVKCWGNAAMCYVKTSSWSDVIYCCNKVLNNVPEESKSNIKIMYRRGLAKMHIGELTDAKSDLMAAYEIDNKNKDVRKAIQDLKKRIADAKKKEKETFGGIFGKTSMYDDKEGPVIPNAKGTNPHVFFDVVHGEEKLGRVVMQLYEGKSKLIEFTNSLDQVELVYTRVFIFNRFYSQISLLGQPRTSENCVPVSQVMVAKATPYISRDALSTASLKTS